MHRNEDKIDAAPWQLQQKLGQHDGDRAHSKLGDRELAAAMDPPARTDHFRELVLACAAGAFSLTGMANGSLMHHYSIPDPVMASPATI